MSNITVQRWSQPETATEARIRDMLDREGLQPYQWARCLRSAQSFITLGTTHNNRFLSPLDS